MADRPRQTPFDPYEGAEPYIFVSYSHSDSARVFPILAALHGQGYRVWYDEGIPWTSEWPAVIESHLSRCAVCLAFLSESFVESKYCRKEIHCAVAESKPILSLYLESVLLRHGLKFQLSDFQSVQFSQFSGIAAFVNRLEHELVFLSCRALIERREEEREGKEEIERFRAEYKEEKKAALHEAKRKESEKAVQLDEAFRIARLAGLSISAGSHHTVGLRNNGRMVAVGWNCDRQCNVSSWLDDWFAGDIVAVSAGGSHTIALCKNGTVKTFGSVDDGCFLPHWRDIVAVSAGTDHTVGLDSKSMLFADGQNVYGQCDVYDWRNIVAVSAGCGYTVGLRRDGTVLAACNKLTAIWCNVYGWRDIVAVSAGWEHTIGLRKNGTVAAVGRNDDGQCNVSDWEDIVAVAAGGDHTVGLRRDGTVAAVGNNSSGQCDVSEWQDIVAVAAGIAHTVGVRRDGTAVAAGDNSYGQCNVYNWHDLRVP